jgi:hypothetical protein
MATRFQAKQEHLRFNLQHEDDPGKKWEFNDKTYLAFLDPEKAFDRDRNCGKQYSRQNMEFQQQSCSNQ